MDLVNRVSKWYRFLNPKTYILTIVILSFVIKLSYSLTRDAFASGPDAPTYIAAIQDISEEGLFSSEITGIPKWPIGYPLIFSIMPKLFNDWSIAIQISQAALTSLAVFLYYQILSNIFGRIIAISSSLIIAFHPVWITSSAMAMYEPTLLFFLIASLYFYTRLISTPKSIPSNLIAGISVGFMTCIHPRLLFIFALILLGAIWRHTRRPHWIPFLLFLFPSIGLPAFFIWRNDRFEGEPTLANSIWDAMTVGHPASSRNGEVCYGNFSCMFELIRFDPMLYAKEFFVNISYFWSPYSGELRRGTWFHRITIEPYLAQFGFDDLFRALLVAFASLGAFLWLYGIARFPSKIKLLKLFLFLEVAVMFITDGMVYGDSRHRIIAMPLMLPFQFWALFELLKRVTNFKNLVTTLGNSD